MLSMNKTTALFAFAGTMLIIACGKKVKPMDPHFYDDQQGVEQSIEDSVDVSNDESALPSEDKSSSQTHSSYMPSMSRSNKTDDYDNMRGFDPASEDDMDDNGMSRYMENDDEEGWD